MENYVLQLAKALISLDQKVTILCERNESKEEGLVGGLEKIDIIVLGNSFNKPRWLAQWGFSRRVSAYLATDPYDKNVTIHSHERTAVHHVTTFHGPPFLCRKQRLLDCLSPRIHMWSYLERRELLATQVQAILPNSPMIADQLLGLYPDTATRVMPPAYPGVTPEFSAIRRESDDRIVIGFLGREWRRKGLDIACLIMESLRELLPNVHFLVAGCNPEEIAPLFAGWPKESYTLAGWLDKPEAFLGKIDLLLHPARSEPFGMAVAEANAARIPVVVSEHCGVSALVGENQGAVCGLEVKQPELGPWVAACYQWLMCDDTVQQLSLSWGGLAQQHITLYEQLMDARR
jgi:UDP-glucose:(heptosyl)LPS alpha-1,3-glucosyltransferase